MGQLEIGIFKYNLFLQQDPERRARFSRTADILARSGLLDVTMRTAELMRRNEQLARDLAQLRRDADAFVRDVLSNPENAHLVRWLSALEKSS